MKIKVDAAALAAVLAAAVSACSSGGGTSGNVAGDSGTTAPGCYATVTPADNDSSVTAAALGTPDCASAVQFPGDQFPGYGHAGHVEGAGQCRLPGPARRRVPGDRDRSDRQLRGHFLEFSPAP